ncbi:uncharacterized protein C8Q71DRAFT_727649 [Rhodofomes roseus]|uniref:Gamma-glutamylcyclotransferase AIG2-like domain-containing protein n=1 Tax=Rhodofomes roseus TaxID=34475 RepID=A0ABQ8K0F5_9APHY|nr:uncharacterized protein C8Q71DRAFT_727649 [Rhodofomes roseus]KAH9830135.1 hypothetical protein C8Q71DRAFT_727649 [Rhodofomes roseus]
MLAPKLTTSNHDRSSSTGRFTLYRSSHEPSHEMLGKWTPSSRLCSPRVSADYPAAIQRTETAVIDGLLFRPQTASQRRKLDDFERETLWTRTGELVDADMYMWQGEPWEVLEGKRELEVFVWERLND